MVSIFVPIIYGVDGYNIPYSLIVGIFSTKEKAYKGLIEKLDEECYLSDDYENIDDEIWNENKFNQTMSDYADNWYEDKWFCRIDEFPVILTR